MLVFCCTRAEYALRARIIVVADRPQIRRMHRCHWVVASFGEWHMEASFDGPRVVSRWRREQIFDGY